MRLTTAEVAVYRSAPGVSKMIGKAPEISV
jgi:hypothetical protein